MPNDAREALIELFDEHHVMPCRHYDRELFIKDILALLADRDGVIEQCAKVVEYHAWLWSDEDVLGAFGRIASAIRALESGAR